MIKSITTNRSDNIRNSSFTTKQKMLWSKIAVVISSFLVTVASLFVSWMGKAGLNSYIVLLIFQWLLKLITFIHNKTHFFDTFYQTIDCFKFSFHVKYPHLPPYSIISASQNTINSSTIFFIRLSRRSNQRYPHNGPFTMFWKNRQKIHPHRHYIRNLHEYFLTWWAHVRPNGLQDSTDNRQQFTLDS